MWKFLKKKMIASVLTIGLAASITGVVLAGICDREFILITGGQVYYCVLELEATYEGFEGADCFYNCYAIN